jgi:hypothetical protein
MLLYILTQLIFITMSKAGVRYHSLWLLLLLVQAMHYQWEIHKADP